MSISQQPSGGGKKGTGSTSSPVAVEVDTPQGKVRCGPDITSEFLDELKNSMNRIDAAYKKFDGCISKANPVHGGNPLAAAKCLSDLTADGFKVFYDSLHSGGTLDFKPPGRRPATAKCPTDCKDTVTLCGYCVTKDFPGNFALGFLSSYAGMGSVVGNVVSFGYSQRYSKGGEQPEDQDAVDHGESAAEHYQASKDKDKSKDKGKSKAGHDDKDLDQAVCGGVREASEKGDKNNFRDCPPCGSERA
jgi:hypothetical protein